MNVVCGWVSLIDAALSQASHTHSALEWGAISREMLLLSHRSGNSERLFLR
jgi:hypothetical protein